MVEIGTTANRMCYCDFCKMVLFVADGGRYAPSIICPRCRKIFEYSL